ncbi:MAG TPA: MmcQ/YjbR family DNA-binding protein [Usitatibacter sp.]|nr:MmcQ/YjbR family DNA-binding protein [Usitatibacter sp.]
MVTIKQARRIAMSLPEAEERQHHGHPDFRVNGRIFATLWPDQYRAVVKLAIPDQIALVQMDPSAFSLNGWSRQGYTTVDLKHIDVSRLRTVMESAWTNVCAKRGGKPQG